MKVGTDNRKEIAALVVLALVAAIVVGRMYMGKPTVSAKAPIPSVAPTTTTAKKPTTQGRTRKKDKRKLPLVASLDPTLRFDLLKSSEDQEYTGGKRNIFEPQAEEIPKPVVSAVKNPTPQVYTPPPPPPPPVIPLKFYGFASKPGEAKKIFLSNGDDVFIGAEGEVINRRYRIVHITNSSVEIEDILNNNRQTIPLPQG
jgi:hypothetical protein